MTEDRRLTDANIERALTRRAPHGADADLLQGIVRAAAQTPQARIWRLPSPWARLALVGVLLAIALAAIGLLIVGSTRPPNLSQLALPSLSLSSPGISPLSSPSPGRSERCTTDTISILTGEALPTSTPNSAPAELPGLGTGRGAFLTSPGGGSPAEVWAAGDGNLAPRRIARVEGSGINRLDLLDLASDGSQVLLRVGKISPAGANPECIDLYAIRVDGSGATRITFLGPGNLVTGAAFSPGGAQIAYAVWNLSAHSTTLYIRDLVTGFTVEHPGCGGFSNYDERMVWSPDSARVALDCGDSVRISTVAGGGDITPPRTAGSVDALGWVDSETISVASSPLGSAFTGLQIERFAATTGALTDRHSAPDDTIDWVTATVVGGFSPDAKGLILSGFLRSSGGGTPPPNSEGAYLVDVDGSQPPRLIKTDVVEAAWSSNGALVYWATGDRPSLTGLDTLTMERSSIGPLPGGYRGGIWQWP